jgi:hypothetical protein
MQVMPSIKIRSVKRETLMGERRSTRFGWGKLRKKTTWIT